MESKRTQQKENKDLKGKKRNSGEQTIRTLKREEVRFGSSIYICFYQQTRQAKKATKRGRGAKRQATSQAVDNE